MAFLLALLCTWMPITYSALRSPHSSLPSLLPALIFRSGLHAVTVSDRVQLNEWCPRSLNNCHVALRVTAALLPSRIHSSRMNVSMKLKSKHDTQTNSNNKRQQNQIAVISVAIIFITLESLTLAVFLLAERKFYDYFDFMTESRTTRRANAIGQSQVDAVNEREINLLHAAAFLIFIYDSNM